MLSASREPTVGGGGMRRGKWEPSFLGAFAPTLVGAENIGKYLHIIYLVYLFGIEFAV